MNLNLNARTNLYIFETLLRLRVADVVARGNAQAKVTNAAVAGELQAAFLIDVGLGTGAIMAVRTTNAGLRSMVRAPGLPIRGPPTPVAFPRRLATSWRK